MFGHTRSEVGLQAGFHSPPQKVTGCSSFRLLRNFLSFQSPSEFYSLKLDSTLPSSQNPQNFTTPAQDEAPRHPPHRFPCLHHHLGHPHRPSPPNSTPLPPQDPLRPRCQRRAPRRGLRRELGRRGADGRRLPHRHGHRHDPVAPPPARRQQRRAARRLGLGRHRRRLRLPRRHAAGRRRHVPEPQHPALLGVVCPAAVPSLHPPAHAHPTRLS